MAADFAINITGDDIEGALRQLIGQVEDTAPAMRAISETMLDSMEQAFEDEADPDTGVAWPALAPATILQREAKGKWPGKMLQLSQGGLASSLSAISGDDFATAGSNKIYARIQALGGKAGRNHAVTIPARNYAGLTPQHRQETLNIMHRHLGG